MNTRSLAPACLAAAAVALSACPKPVVTPLPPPIEKPAPPPIRIPEGCEADLSGDYAHALNASYRYRGEDDGGTLSLLVQRPATDGGSVSEDGGTFITLSRTQNGFVGATDALVFTQRGGQCRVAFPTDVVSCFDGGLLLRSASSASVDDTCGIPKTAAPAPRVEHRLLRVLPPGEDAGAAEPLDAGQPLDAGSSLSAPGKTEAVDGG